MSGSVGRSFEQRHDANRHVDRLLGIAQKVILSDRLMLDTDQGGPNGIFEFLRGPESFERRGLDRFPLSPAPASAFENSGTYPVNDGAVATLESALVRSLRFAGLEQVFGAGSNGFFGHEHVEEAAFLIPECLLDDVVDDSMPLIEKIRFIAAVVKCRGGARISSPLLKCVRASPA